MNYVFLIRPCADLVRVTLPWHEDVTQLDFDVETEARALRVTGGRFGPVDEGDERGPIAELSLDFPDDAAALGFVKTFDALCLDPWRVDFVYRCDANGEYGDDTEVYAR